MNSPGPRPPDEILRQIAGQILHDFPVGSLPAEVAQALESPTLQALQTAGNGLLASGQLAAAEAIFHALADWSRVYPWIPAGLARVATRRKNWPAAASAWLLCLAAFPTRPAPDWLVGLALAERQLGHHAQAQARLLACRQQFPHFAPAAAALAELYRLTGQHELAAATWETAIRDFPGAARPAWFLGLAGALRDCGHAARADETLDDMVTRFPGSAPAMVRQANSAARREDWQAALDIWTVCIQDHPLAMQPTWLTGRAMALFRLWRVEAAMDAWADAIQRFPDDIPARIQMAKAAGDLGDWHVMREGFTTLIARFPGQLAPEWLGGLARAQFMTKSYEDASRLTAALTARFPESSLGDRLSVDFANALQAGLNALSQGLQAGLRRFPDERYLLAEQVRVLLAAGQMDDAERIAARLEATANDALALTCRWRIAMDRAGEDVLRDIVQNEIAARAWTPESALRVVNFLQTIWSKWPVELAARLLEDVTAKFPGRFPVACAHARALIGLRKFSAALAIIDALPPILRTQDALELRAWADSLRGAHATARQTWQTILSRHYFPAIHSAEPLLERVTPETDEEPPHGVIAFLNIRNEMAHLSAYLHHHRAIGVRRFVCVDNMSRDEGAEFMQAQPDVILYRTADDFQTSSAGMRWVNLLRERHGAGAWCLYADADEALIYPGWETIPLDEFTAYLDQEGAQALGAFMLDVYPKRLLNDAQTPAPREDYRYYDANYQWIGQVRAPYLQPVGGVRGRLFQVNEYLHKVPLLRHATGTYLNSHNTTPVRLSGVSGTLLHYKLLNLALRFRPLNRADSGNPYMADRSPDLMRRYVRYTAHMEQLRNADLWRAGISEPLADSLTLADRDIMRVPASYRDWLRARLQRDTCVIST